MTGDPIDCKRCDQPHPRCSGHNKQGAPCMRWPKRGAKVCPRHGGHAPQVLAKAAERVAEERVRKLAAQYSPAAAPVKDPLLALLSLAGEISTFKDFIGGRVAEMKAEEWRYKGEHAEQLRAEIALYERALDRTARVLVDINRLNLEARLAAVFEQVGPMLVQLVEGLLADGELGLSEGQRERGRRLVEARLTELTQGAA